MKNTLLNFWKKHRKALIFMAVITVAATILLPHLAFAQDAASSLPPSSDEAKLQTALLSFLRTLMEWLQRVLWPILLLIGGLMNNDILFGAGMEDRSLLIWQQVRNLVNVLFVLILLAIALYNVVGGQNQSWQLKAILPKFVIALIVVNFSFAGLKIALDGVNVISTAIFAMPESVQGGLSELPTDGEWQKKICTGLYGDPTVYEKAIAEAEKVKAGSALCTESRTFTDNAKTFFARYGGHNAAMVLAVNFGNIADYDKVKLSLTSVPKLVINMLFSVIFYLIYAISFVALMIVLLVRVIVLWLLLVLSPLAALTMVLPEELKKSLGEAGDLKDKFVQHAIVPVPIAMVMTIGFILLKGFNAAVVPGISVTTPTLGVGLLISGVSTFQELIIAIASVGFIWTGVFAAADKTMAGKFTGKLKDMAQGAGKFVGTAWQYAPILPVQGAKDEKGNPIKVSLAGAMGLTDYLQSARSEKARKDMELAAQNLSSSQAAKIGNEMRDAGAQHNYDKFMQKLKKQSDAGLMTVPRVQEDMAFAVKQNETWKKKIETEIDFELKDKKGNTFNKTQLWDKLAKGEVSDETMTRLGDRLTKGVAPEKEEKPGKGKPGEAGPAGAIEPDRADYLEANGGQYMAGLDKKEKDAIAAYRQTRDDKKATKEKKAAALKAAQSGLAKIDAAMEGKSDAMYAAATATTADGVIAAIENRRKQLKKANIEGKAADDILSREFSTPEIVANVKKVNGGNTGIGGIDVGSPAPAPAPEPAPASADKKTPPKPAPPKKKEEKKQDTPPPTGAPSGGEGGSSPAPTPAPAAPLSSSAVPTKPIPQPPPMWTGSAQDYWQWNGTDWVPKG